MEDVDLELHGKLMQAALQHAGVENVDSDVLRAVLNGEPPKGVDAQQIIAALKGMCKVAAFVCPIIEKL
jgi:hypothetical protein